MIITTNTFISFFIEEGKQDSAVPILKKVFSFLNGRDNLVNNLKISNGRLSSPAVLFFSFLMTSRTSIVGGVITKS